MNNDYLDRAKYEVERARKRLPHYAGSCAACRWSYPSLMGRICEHPAVVCAAFNVTDDYGKRRIQECVEQRDRDSVFGQVVCGPNGVLFEPKQSLWSRLFGKAKT
jgi:hypothetical protein